MDVSLSRQNPHARVKYSVSELPYWIGELQETVLQRPLANDFPVQHIVMKNSRSSLCQPCLARRLGFIADGSIVVNDLHIFLLAGGDRQETDIQQQVQRRAFHFY